MSIDKHLHLRPVVTEQGPILPQGESIINHRESTELNLWLWRAPPKGATIRRCTIAERKGGHNEKVLSAYPRVEYVLDKKTTFLYLVYQELLVILTNVVVTQEKTNLFSGWDDENVWEKRVVSGTALTEGNETWRGRALLCSDPPEDDNESGASYMETIFSVSI